MADRIKTKITGPLRNSQGSLSGAKLVLISACLLAVCWLARDLAAGISLTEWHTVLMGILLVVGLVNRVSARGRFKIRIGRDGGELEADNRDQ